MIINILYILLVILIFGLLITFHEFGHFITAKLSGVRVNEFAVGMGPAIFKKKKGETVYALRAIPFGGFCAMEGEDGESQDPGSFQSKPLWKRILIVVAGSVMNLLVGLAVLAILFAPTKAWYVPTIAALPENDAALTQSGLVPGDTIRRVNGYRVHMYNDVFLGLERGTRDGAYTIEILRDGKKMTLTGLPTDLYKAFSDDQVTFAVERSSFLNKTKFIFQNGYNLVRLVKVGLVDLVTGNASVKEMAGPIGIGQMMVDTAKASMPSLWFLVAFISINLGIMNLLPLPALDGGRLLFLIIELVRRKPIDPKYEAYVHGAGLILLMLLMVFVTFNDILRIFGK